MLDRETSVKDLTCFLCGITRQGAANCSARSCGNVVVCQSLLHLFGASALPALALDIRAWHLPSGSSDSARNARSESTQTSQEQGLNCEAAAAFTPRLHCSSLNAGGRSAQWDREGQALEMRAVRLRQEPPRGWLRAQTCRVRSVFTKNQGTTSHQKSLRPNHALTDVVAENVDPLGNLTALGVDVAHICEDLKKSEHRPWPHQRRGRAGRANSAWRGTRTRSSATPKGRSHRQRSLSATLWQSKEIGSLRSELVQLQHAINTAVCRHDRHDQCRQFRQSVGVRVLALPDPVDADVGNLQYQASQWLCWPRTWPKEWRPRRLRELALTTTAGLRAAAKRMRTCHPSRKINMV